MFKKLGKKRALLFLALAAVLSYFFTMLMFYYAHLSGTGIYEIRELGMDVYVQGTAGFNVDSDAVHFGMVPPGSKGRRNITIDNDNVPNMVRIEAYGDIAEWVYVSDNDFILGSYESKSLLVSVSVPPDAEVPDFKNGTLRILFMNI